MTIEARKLAFIQKILALKDEAILTMIEESVTPLIDAENELKPMSLEEFNERIEASEKSSKKYSIEEMRKTIQTWGQ